MAHITAWSTYRLKKVHISIDRGRRPSDSDSESTGLCTAYSVRKYGRRFRWCWLFIIVPLAALLLIKFLTHDGTHNAYVFLGIFVTVALILVLVCIPLAIGTGYKQSPIVEYNVSSSKATTPDSTTLPTASNGSSIDNCIECPTQQVLFAASDSTTSSCHKTDVDIKSDYSLVASSEVADVLPLRTEPVQKETSLTVSENVEYTGDITDKMLLSS